MFRTCRQQRLDNRAELARSFGLPPPTNLRLRLASPPSGPETTTLSDHDRSSLSASSFHLDFKPTFSCRNSRTCTFMSGLCSYHTCHLTFALCTVYRICICICICTCTRITHFMLTTAVTSTFALAVWHSSPLATHLNRSHSRSLRTVAGSPPCGKVRRPAPPTFHRFACPPKRQSPPSGPETTLSAIFFGAAVRPLR